MMSLGVCPSLSVSAIPLLIGNDPASSNDYTQLFQETPLLMKVINKQIYIQQVQLLDQYQRTKINMNDIELFHNM